LNHTQKHFISFFCITPEFYPHASNPCHPCLTRDRMISRHTNQLLKTCNSLYTPYEGAFYATQTQLAHPTP
jgi:hypothetical protein